MEDTNVELSDEPMDFIQHEPYFKEPDKIRKYNRNKETEAFHIKHYRGWTQFKHCDQNIYPADISLFNRKVRKINEKFKSKKKRQNAIELLDNNPFIVK
eukprot:UN15930